MVRAAHYSGFVGRAQSMPGERTGTRREFLRHAGVLGGLMLGDSLWSVKPVGATETMETVGWTSSNRSLTGPMQNPLHAVAADRTAKTAYFAMCDGSGSIQFARSLDEGRTFSAFTPIPGIGNASDVPLDRCLVVDEITKRVHLLYSVAVDDANAPASLRYIHSDDGGASWSAPLTLDDGTTSTGLNHGVDRFIRVAMAATGGVMHIGWASISNTTFLTDGMFYVRSSNGGQSFTPPARPFPGTVSPSRPDIATFGDTVLLVWTDARYGSAYNGNPGEVFLGRSTDGGSHWTQRRLTLTAKRWGAGTTLRPVICAGNDHTVTVVWQDPDAPPMSGAGGVTGFNSPGTENLYWAHSSDGGAHWGSIRTLAQGARTQNHAYLVQSGNVVGCAWSDERTLPAQMRVALSTTSGATFGPSTQPMHSSGDQVAPMIVASEGFLQAYAPEGTDGVFEARLPYRRHTLAASRRRK
jgi:hypothetical protein